ncbi:MAG: hypothetical protein ACXIVQ_07620 [Acidimicrobiales bacterium]
MDTTAPTSVCEATTPERSAADRRMRRLLRLPVDGPKVSLFAAQSAFSKSIAISATRCLITYVLLPILRPLIDLSGGVGPALGLTVGFVSMVAIVFAVRRFFAADHKWRWGYTWVGGGIFVLLTVQAIVDVRALLG